MHWDTVLRLADGHGVTSLLYQNLLPFESSVPTGAMKSLREKNQINVHKTLFLARELVRVLECADQSGVEIISYKGLILAEAFYGDMAARMSGDIDLFVRPGDVEQLKSAMKELGYISRVAIREEMEAAYIASGYEWTFDSPAGKNLLELQWALQPRFYAVDFDMEGLFARAQRAEFSGREIRTPSAEDLLIVLSMHAAKHVWGRLIWLCDIARILRRELDWNWVGKEASSLGIERILHVTLLLGNRLLEMEIPAEMDKEVRSDGVAQRFTDEVAASVVAGVEYEEEKISYFRIMMWLRERRWDRMRFFSRLLFTPGPGEWDVVRLPRVLHPLYRVVRLGRLTGRLAR